MIKNIFGIKILAGKTFAAYGILIVVLALIMTGELSAKTSDKKAEISKKFWTTMIFYPYGSENYTPGNIFQKTSFKKSKNPDGFITTSKIDYIKASGRNIIFSITTRAGKTQVSNMLITFQYSPKEKLNYVFNIKMRNMINKSVNEIKYDGSTESLGELIGAFDQLIRSLFFDEDELDLNIMSDEDKAEQKAELEREGN